MAAYPLIPISYPVGESGLDYKVIETSMEYGYVQTRPAITLAPREWQFSHKLCTAAERVTWLAFWNARKGRGEVFTFVNPADGSVVNVRFKQTTPEILWVEAFRRFNINVKLEEAL